MTFALGSDFSCVEDIDANLSATDGRNALAQAVARRIITPTGGLFYNPDYGNDVRRYLNNSSPTATRIAADAQGEAEKDERVDRADASAVLSDSNKRLTLSLRLQDGEGPFDLTLNVDELTAELLIESGEV